MKQISLFLLKLLSLFLLFFLIGRLFFLQYNADKLAGFKFGHILLSNIYGIPLDLSAFGYIVALPTILLIVGNFYFQKRIIRFINIFIAVFIVLCSFINIADTALVSSLGTKISAKAISYILYPKLVKTSILSVNYKTLLLFFAVHAFIFVYAYFKWVKIKTDYKIKLKHLWLFLPVIAVVFTMIRGGWGNNPIGKSRGVYSENLTLNLATINGFWNSADAIFKDRSKEQSYHFFELNDAEKQLKGLINLKNNSGVSILKTKRPNIVVLLLESYTGENMTRLGGKESIAPCLDSLSYHSLFFTNFFATGFRTEQGLVGLLSGFPSQPKHSIQRDPSKIFKLPIMSKKLKNEGYSSHFFFTEDIEYGRTNEYLMLGQFEKIYSWPDFLNVPRTGSGAYDEYLFKFQLEKTRQIKQPFFSISLTSSTHPPSDGNFPQIFKGNKEVDHYKNAAHYTDRCIIDFLNKAKKEAWYANTLFVIVADHCTGHPVLRDNNQIESHRIPLLLYGDVLKDEWIGKTMDLPSTQTDLPATLLAQLGIPSDEFEFSRNIFDFSQPHFAYYTFDDGFGMIAEKDAVFYDNSMKKVFTGQNGKPVNTELLNQGKAYLQVLMNRFSNLE